MFLQIICILQKPTFIQKLLLGHCLLTEQKIRHSLWANSKGDPPLRFLLLCLSSAPAPREERGDLPWEPGLGTPLPWGDCQLARPLGRAQLGSFHLGWDMKSWSYVSWGHGWTGLGGSLPRWLQHAVAHGVSARGPLRVAAAIQEAKVEAAEPFRASVTPSAPPCALGHTDRP